MVLTAAQTAAFFEDAAQMGIPHVTVLQLQLEGISTVDDLADFDKDSLQQLADNLRRPGGRVPDPNPNAAPGATIPTPPFVFGAKSQKRLLVACNLVRYYDTVGRPLSAANLQWNTVMKNFEIQWKALKDRKDAEEPDVPKISKALPVIKWTEAFRDFLHRVIGVRMIPLAYVIRTDVVPVGVVPALEAGQPHAAVHGSIELELIARASHAHALFRDDNSSVYFFLEEATRSTQYAASIKPFQRGKDGRGAWLAISSQYAGLDKWEAEIKKQEQLLHTRVWKGQSNFPLEGFVSQHRNAFVSLQQCAEHVTTFQLPSEHSRVGFIIEGIQATDAGLQAAIASVKTSTAPDGLRNNFEACVAHLLPYDPVAKKRAEQGRKRGAAQISNVDVDEEGGEISTTHGGKSKPSIGKTGVHLRYHKTEEYRQLTTEQKNELREWRLAHPEEMKKAKKPKSAKASKRFKKQVATIVAQQVEAEVKKALEPPTNGGDASDDATKLISSMVDLAVTKKVADVHGHPEGHLNKITLQSILKRSKNQA